LLNLEQDYGAKDSILYALGVGFGLDPNAPGDLHFTYEGRLRAVPTMTCVLAHPGFWFKDPVYKIDWVKILHGGQEIEMLRPLPPAGRVRAEYRILSVDDKGSEKGAILTQEKTLYDLTNGGAVIGKIKSVVMLRGDGGCGSFGEKAGPPLKTPEGTAAVVLDLKMFPQAALLYRLNGDWNPIHADPEIAGTAGFPRPILHGLCTMGVACRGLLVEFCGHDPTRLKRMKVRFTRPVFPEETLRLEAWPEFEGRIVFRLRAVERDLIVMDGCEAIVTSA
jgi:acyl dehydratase